MSLDNITPQEISQHYGKFHNRPGFSKLRTSPEDIKQICELALLEATGTSLNKNARIASRLFKQYKQDLTFPVTFDPQDSRYADWLIYTPPDNSTILDDLTAGPKRLAELKEQIENFKYTTRIKHITKGGRTYTVKGKRKFISGHFKFWVVRLTFKDFVRFKLLFKNLCKLLGITPQQLSRWRKEYHLDYSLWGEIQQQTFYFFCFVHRRFPDTKRPKDRMLLAELESLIAAKCYIAHRQRISPRVLAFLHRSPIPQPRYLCENKVFPLVYKLKHVSSPLNPTPMFQKKARSNEVVLPDSNVAYWLPFKVCLLPQNCLTSPHLHALIVFFYFQITNPLSTACAFWRQFPVLKPEKEKKT